MTGSGFPGLPIITQLRTVPPVWSAEMHPRASAVLLLFIQGSQEHAEPRIVFTRRSTLVRTHKGQIGFPGGRREESDADPVATALRETHEEIGLPPDAVEILGSLPPLPGLDRRAIVPIVGFSHSSLQDFQANADEVAELFAIPWSEFSLSASQKLKFNVFGRWRDTPYFPAQGYHIWGLTAWILKQAELKSPS